MSAASVRNEQESVAQYYAERYGIDQDDVLFLSDRDPYEPWFTKEALLAICRTSPGVREIGERFAGFSPELKQIFHEARLVNDTGKVFVLSGVATLGERLPGSEKEADPHRLAAARALHAVMDAAGLNPLKPATLSTEGPAVADDPERRNNDLKRIHVLARDAGMLKGKNTTEYRKWLKEHFAVSSSVRLDQRQRASAIALLSQRKRRN